MATPTFRALRHALPGAFIGALVRPGIDQLLAGLDYFDELHVERASGVMGPKFVAAKVRPRRYDTALLLANSFSSALIARIAGIPRRIGYDRDLRGLLLTDPVPAPRTPAGRWAVISAVEYYWRLAHPTLIPLSISRPSVLELRTTPADEAAAAAVLARGDISLDLSTNVAHRPACTHAGRRFSGLALLNPGGNNPAKRWPADRFAALARHLAEQHHLLTLLNGSPGESELCAGIAAAAPGVAISLPQLGMSLAALKALAPRARLMVTNDTGPRHVAASFGVPLISLFGPTDHRWTTIPTRPDSSETIIVADPTLPPDQIANDHPERCRIEAIDLETVRQATDTLLARAAPPPLL